MITLPWSCVMHDNHRLMPVKRGKKVMLITAPKYRDAKANAEILVMAQWREAKLTGGINLHAIAYFPDRRKRDAGNYRKLITDAMSEICYADDAQLLTETWECGGIDKDNPRIEITLRPRAA